MSTLSWANIGTPMYSGMLFNLDFESLISIWMQSEDRGYFKCAKFISSYVDKGGICQITKKYCDENEFNQNSE